MSICKSTPRNERRAIDKLSYILTELGKLKSRQEPSQWFGSNNSFFDWTTSQGMRQDRQLSRMIVSTSCLLPSVRASLSCSYKSLSDILVLTDADTTEARLHLGVTFPSVEVEGAGEITAVEHAIKPLMMHCDQIVVRPLVTSTVVPLRTQGITLSLVALNSPMSSATLMPVRV